VTRMSKSKTRSVAAIGNSRVIPAYAGIQRRTTADSRLRGNDAAQGTNRAEKT
jgi:hypothetical protein